MHSASSLRAGRLPFTAAIRARSLRPILVFLLSVVLLPSADATVILHLDLKQLVGRSDRIFSGRVVELKSSWTKNRRRIVTDATVVVDEPVLGVKRGERIVVRRLGGTVDGIGMKVFGAAVLGKGDRVLLFTEKRGNHRYVVGMRQGIFRMSTAADGKLLVRQHLGGLELVKRQQATAATAKKIDGSKLERVSAARISSSKVPLTTMLTRVRQIIASCRRSPGRCTTTR